MRHGACVLFVIALLVLIGSFAGTVVNAPLFDRSSLLGQQQPTGHLWLFVTGAINALHVAALPFFGAVLIDRLDRWREHTV
jgi:hypothetical protein